MIFMSRTILFEGMNWKYRLKYVYIEMEVQQTAPGYYIASGTSMNHLNQACVYFGDRGRPLAKMFVPCKPGTGTCVQTLEASFWNITEGGKAEFIVASKQDVQTCFAGKLLLTNYTEKLARTRDVMILPTSPYDPRISNFGLVNLLKYLAQWTLKSYIPTIYFPPTRRMDPMWANRYYTSIQESGQTHSILTGDQKFNFLTCDGVRVYWDFGFYWIPYDMESWVMTTVSVFVLGSITALVYWLAWARTQANTECKRNLRIVLTETLTASFSTLVGIGYNSTVEAFAEKLSSQYSLLDFVRITLGIWTFMTIVLTNAYLGLVTALSTAPNPQSAKWTHLAGMSGFRFYASADVIESLTRASAGKPFEGFPVRFGDLPYESICVRGGEVDLYFKAFGDCKRDNATPVYFKDPEDKHRLRWFMFHDLKQMTAPQKMYESFKLVNAVIGGPTDAYSQHLNYDVFAKKLSSCSKNGYIGTLKQLDSFITYAKKNTVTINGRVTEIEFKKGKDELLSESVGLSFDGWGGPAAFERMQLRMQAGIPQLWSTWYLMFKSRDFSTVQLNAEDTTPKSLTLGSNIVTTFLIWLCCLGICITMLLLETSTLVTLESAKTSLIQFRNNFVHTLQIKSNRFGTRLPRRSAITASF